MAVSFDQSSHFRIGTFLILDSKRGPCETYREICTVCEEPTTKNEVKWGEQFE
jgi:hypothetical protein